MPDNIYINAKFLTQRITGVQRFAFEISQELIKIYPKIIFVVPNHVQNINYHSKFNIVSCGVNKGNLWEQIDLIMFLKKRGNPLLLNLTNSAPLLYKNKIVTIHDLSFEQDPKWFSFRFRTLYKFLVPRNIKRAKLVLTVSNFSKKELIRYYKVNIDKIKVVYNSFNKQKFYINNSKKYEEEYLLMTFSLSPRKNILNALKAYCLLKTDVKLYIAGSPDKNLGNLKIEKEYLNNRKITFLGYVDDNNLLNLYNNALGFVYPSLYEGFGLPPIEAQACGCPCIVSDIPVLREVYKESTLYFNPKDPLDISDKMRKLIFNKKIREELVDMGLDNCRKYDWSRSAKIVIESINKLSD